MNDQEAELYAQICQFQLDDPTSPYPMSVKLVWEHHWSEIYTLRAINEYKKFIFLAVVAEGTVAPSSIIDDVWHHHLLYTYSYWEELCGNTLKKSLHHYPGDPGSSERYNYTLDLYHSYFGSPPSDIWDLPPLHSNHLARNQRYWRIPDPIHWLTNIWITSTTKYRTRTLTLHR
jgi:hypothetical protein